VLQKKNILNPNDPVGSLAQFIKVRPVGIRKIQVVTEDLKNLQFLISKLTDKHITDLLTKFTETDCEILIDYLHRFMRFVGDENLSSGLALNIEEEIIKKWGPMIIVQAASRVDSVN
jgi:hypothetical protein